MDQIPINQLIQLKCSASKSLDIVSKLHRQFRKEIQDCKADHCRFISKVKSLSEAE